MQRTSFDVNSIAALLRQTEANLAALKPRHEPYVAEHVVPSTASLPRLGSGVELETQVVQLRSCIETLERRLEVESGGVWRVALERKSFDPSWPSPTSGSRWDAP